MEIAAGLVALGQVAAVMKTVIEVDKTYDAAKFKAQMADAMVALADAKLALIDAREKLREKDEEIVRLQKQFDFRDELVEVNGYKYRKNLEDGTPSGMPFCARCEAVDGRYIQLAKTIIGRNLGCPQCNANYVGVMTYR
jgi:hypothetical protein